MSNKISPMLLKSQSMRNDILDFSYFLSSLDHEKECSGDEEKTIL